MKNAAAAFLLALPSVAQSDEILDRDCMATVGTVAYGPHNFTTGVLTGIIMGYAIAHGASESEAEESAGKLAAECRANNNMTLREALRVLD